MDPTTVAAPNAAKAIPMLLNILFSLSMLFTMIWGFILCFFGYRILKIILVFYGFLAGVGVAMYLNLCVLHTTGGGTLLLVLGLGVLGAVASFLLLYVGVFLLGALLGVGVTLFVGVVIGHHAPSIVFIAHGHCRRCDDAPAPPVHHHPFLRAGGVAADRAGRIVHDERSVRGEFARHRNEPVERAVERPAGLPARGGGRHLDRPSPCWAYTASTRN